MQRREFMGLVGGAAAWPLAAQAQQAERARRIGVLMGYGEADREGQAFLAAFREGLQKFGWTEGPKLQVDARWGAGNIEFTRQSATELVGLKPDLILSHSTVTTAALLKATSTIPVIFANVTDPVGSGFVANFPKPGGNATGLVNMEDSMSGKWLQLLKEVAPRTERVGFLFNPTTAPYFDYYLSALKSAAPLLGVEVAAAPVNDRGEIESVIAELGLQSGAGMIVMTDNFTTTNRLEIVTLAARHRLPAIYPYRFFVDLGGLLSYGSDIPDNFRRAAGYADRILRGASPQDLPVQAPIKFELVVNLKAAKELGLEIPAQLQQRADDIIE
jgi:putative ABC transport system substrate-binding protein